MHYHIGHNMPGYLPESDVDTYDDIDDAIDGLIADLVYSADSYDTWVDDHDCDDIPCPTYGDDCPFMKARDLETEAMCLTQSRQSVKANGDFLIYAAGQAWWINPCTDDCETEDSI